MAGITGIDSVIYGAVDLEEGKKFLSDWGLTLVEQTDEAIVFETMEKSQVILKPIDSPELPSAIEEGPTIREIVWGAESQADLDVFLAGIKDKVELFQAAGGLTKCVDPNGLTIAFKVTHRVATGIKGAASNAVGVIQRIDQAAPVYQRATPVRIAHAVFFVDDLPAHIDFYVNKLGFNVTDEYPGRGAFIRCVEEGTHHNLFFLSVEHRGRGLNHLSFTLRDIYEVMGGGIHFSKCGWDTQIGPGRHPISSAFFWYFHSPLGGLFEYYADEDYLTEAWTPRQHEVSPENFAEWAIADGIDPKTRRQRLRKA